MENVPPLSGEELEARVNESLGNAIDNGYEKLIFSWTPEQIVGDLKTCDADLESIPEEMLLPLVKKWLSGAFDGT